MLLLSEWPHLSTRSVSSTSMCTDTYMCTEGRLYAHSCATASRFRLLAQICFAFNWIDGVLRHRSFTLLAAAAPTRTYLFTCSSTTTALATDISSHCHKPSLMHCGLSNSSDAQLSRCSSHTWIQPSQGLGLSVWLLQACQDVAVLQAVLLAGGVRCPLWPSSHAALLILGLSHAKGLGCAVWLLDLMLWACQDVAVLQAVLLACGFHSIDFKSQLAGQYGEDKACSHCSSRTWPQPCQRLEARCLAAHPHALGLPGCCCPASSPACWWRPQHHTPGQGTQTCRPCTRSHKHSRYM
jgi:hypothetical protein